MIDRKRLRELAMAAQAARDAGFATVEQCDAWGEFKREATDPQMILALLDAIDAAPTQPTGEAK